MIVPDYSLVSVGSRLEAMDGTRKSKRKCKPNRREDNDLPVQTSQDDDESIFSTKVAQSAGKPLQTTQKKPSRTKIARNDVTVPPSPWGRSGTSSETVQVEPDGSSQQEIIDLKIKNAALEQRVEMLTEDRNYLRERLKEALQGQRPKRAASPDVSPEPWKKKAKILEDSNSNSESSESESDSEPSIGKKEKKITKRTKKPKKIQMRVKTPDDAVDRYNMVLAKVKKEKISKAEAYARLKVDRNTIAQQAPIAELAIANPDLYSTLRLSFKRKDSLKRFADTCRGFCEQEPTASAIAKKKDDGSLLDIFKQ
ncbi:coiled-coil domain-containing protein 106-like isoform X2 [Sardina pilchardus]|uniref:coiled-coil domain-containing protein 106-like isoform X2 n=1 Tax=Sardina pilchardus TaxID=27697 RepID=UPI002E143356